MSGRTQQPGVRPGGFALRVDADTRLVLPVGRLAPVVFALVRGDQADFARWEQWAVPEMTLERTTQRLEEAMVDFARGRRVPTCLEWRGRIVGGVTARVDEWSASAELGYHLATHARGHGLATRGARALIGYVIESVGVERVYVQAAVDNTASRAVAERLGLHEEGILRSAWSVAGRPRVDAALYGISAEEWSQRAMDFPSSPT